MTKTFFFHKTVSGNFEDKLECTTFWNPVDDYAHYKNIKMPRYVPQVDLTCIVISVIVKWINFHDLHHLQAAVRLPHTRLWQHTATLGFCTVWIWLHLNILVSWAQSTEPGLDTLQPVLVCLNLEANKTVWGVNTTACLHIGSKLQANTDSIHSFSKLLGLGCGCMFFQHVCTSTSACNFMMNIWYLVQLTQMTEK